MRYLKPRSIIALCQALLLAGAPTPADAQSSASAYTTGYRYDAMDNLTGMINADPGDISSPVYAAVRNTYDSMNRLIKVEKGALSAWQPETTAPASWSGFTVYVTVDTTYDGAGNKLEDATSSGGTTVEVTQYSYDALWRLDCTAVRMNLSSLPSDACTAGTTGSDGPDRISKNIYDVANQVLQVRRAMGTGIEQAYSTYSYTANGRRADVIDANGNHALQVYDEFDRQVQWQFPSTTGPSSFDGSTPATALATAGSVNSSDYEQYGYDEDFNRISLRKRDGSTIGYSYDALNRMTVKDIPGGTSADVYSGYDLLGHQLYARFSSTSGQGVTSVYDGFGRLTSSTNNLGGISRALNYTYDADGNRTYITHPDGTYFSTVYDGLDRASATYENSSTAIVWFSYNAQGQRSTISRANSAGTAYSYDGVERLNSLSQDLAGSGSDQTWSLAYNPASQIRTSGLTNTAYAWTGNVNGSQSYTPNGLNQYAAVAGTGFTYDANGNLTSDGSTSYGYDVENRLVSASGAHTDTLVYDPNGRLFQVAAGSGGSATWGSGQWGSMVWGAGGSSGPTQFLYDGDALVAEYDGSGTLLRRYVHGPGVDEPLVWYEGSGLTDRRFQHADHQGSVAAISNASGTATAINSYSEYGVPAAANLGRFQFTGQIWLPELGVYHYKARVYSPGLGRFFQTDPVGYQNQINLYAYVGNDPTNKTDPSGNCIEDGCIVEFTAIGAGIGAVVGGATYAISAGDNFSTKGLLGAAGSGALTGAAIGFSASAGGLATGVAGGLAGAAARGAVFGAAGSALGDIASGNQIDAKKAAVSGVAGALGGVAGGAAIGRIAAKADNFLLVLGGKQVLGGIAAGTAARVGVRTSVKTDAIPAMKNIEKLTARPPAPPPTDTYGCTGSRVGFCPQ